VKDQGAGKNALDGTIGARVLIWRRRRDLTLEELAARAGVHANTIWRLEEGRGCSVATAAKVAAALEVEIAVLIPNSQHVVRNSKDSLFR